MSKRSNNFLYFPHFFVLLRVDRRRWKIDASAENRTFCREVSRVNVNTRERPQSSLSARILANRVRKIEDTLIRASFPLKPTTKSYLQMQHFLLERDSYFFTLIRGPFQRRNQRIKSRRERAFVNIPINNIVFMKSSFATFRRAVNTSMLLPPPLYHARAGARARALPSEFREL